MGVAGRLVSNCVRYRCGSTPWRRQVLVSELRTAAVRPPRALPTNSGFFRLCRARHSRNNWLFAGNDAAGASHARLWTLIASAERHGIDPQAYLRSVLAKIGRTPVSALGQFLPDAWRREQTAAAAAPAQPPPG